MIYFRHVCATFALCRRAHDQVTTLLVEGLGVDVWFTERYRPRMVLRCECWCRSRLLSLACEQLGWRLVDDHLLGLLRLASLVVERLRSLAIWMLCR